MGSKSFVLLGGIPDENNKNLLFVVSLGLDLVDKGIHAGKFINNISKICSGGGGGKSNIAQAGAKDYKQLGNALVFAKQEIINILAQSDK